MIATQRLNDDRKLLDNLRRADVAQARPAQLDERKVLVAGLAADPAEAKQEAAHAAEVKAAERAVQEARVNLRRAEDHVSDLWRRSHGQSHGRITRDQNARHSLRETAHPAISFVERALWTADLAAMAVTPSITGVEITETPIEPTAEEARRQWFKPFMRRERQPVSSLPAQRSFMEAIRAARQRVDDLQYADLDDDAVVVKLRDEIDQLVAMHVPMSLEHIRLNLSALRRKLDRSALELWTIAEEGTR